MSGSALLIERLKRALRRTGQFATRRRLLDRPFSTTADKRLLLVSLGHRIPQSQIHPFRHFAQELRLRHGAEVREVLAEDVLCGRKPSAVCATTVAFQTPFDIPEANLLCLLQRLTSQNPGARLVYLDWFAPTDLRLAAALDPHISVYVKKHVLRDRACYGVPTLGDTNLTDYYSRRFSLDAEPTQFPVPDGFFDKLIVGPPFATADFMLDGFFGPPPTCGERPIDVHARLAVNGTPWYQRMRSECVDALGSVADLRIVVGVGVGHAAYVAELRASKICFSPFGYGEVCWRDYEAVANGAVLLKPDMSHIVTDPDIFVPGKTYVPLRWDLSDLEEKVRVLVATPDLRREIAETAFGVLHDYMRSGRFVDQMATILS